MPGMIKISCSILIGLGLSNIKLYGVTVAADDINQCIDHHFSTGNKVPFQQKK